MKRPDEAPWSRREQLALLVFAASILASLALLVHPWYDAVRDGSIYIGTAKSLLAGEGFRYLGVPYVAHRPGFSALIAPVLAVFGTSFGALNLSVSLFGAAGVVLLAILLRDRVGLSLALLTALAVWLNPRYQQLCNQVMSDVPGVALVLGCLLLERWASRAPSWRREIALGLAIGASVYVRSTCLLLIPAIAVARWWRQSGAGTPSGGWPGFLLQRIVVVGVIAAALLAPWSLRNQFAAPPAPVDQFTVYDYSTAMWRRDAGDPASPRLSIAEVLARIPLRVEQTAKVLGGRLGPTVRGNEPLGEPIGALDLATSLFFAAAWLYVARKRRAPAELFVAATLAVMGVYFSFLDRLVLPLYVFGLAAGVELARDGIARVAGPRLGGAAIAVALVGLILVDLEPHKGWDEIEATNRRNRELGAELNARLSSDARIGAPLGFSYGVYFDRPVYSLWIAVDRAGDAAAAEAVIDTYDLDTVVTSGRGPMHRVLGPYLEAHYGPGEKIGSALLWRVRP